MKHIIFVRDLKTETDFTRIKEYLDNTRVDYSVSLATQSVSVHGSNDKVFSAKQAILLAGYSID